MHKITTWRAAVIFFALGMLSILMLNGCMVGPNFQAPQAQVSAAWIGVSETPTAHPSMTTAQPADLAHWWQQFHDPQLTALGASAYDKQLFDIAGNDAVEGAYFFLPSAMYLGEDRAVNKEVDLFNTWMKKTHPTDPVDLFAVYGWASARLFTQALQAAGPRATRAGLLGALRNIHQFDSNTLLAPGDPAGKGAPHCYILLRAHAGNFARIDSPPPGYRCDGTYFLKQ